MSRTGKVFFKDKPAGQIEQRADASFEFRYLKGAPAVSLTLPSTESVYNSEELFPFFDGLIPEGWLLNLVRKNWKLQANDRLSLLLVACRDCIGAASVQGGRAPMPAEASPPAMKALAKEASAASSRCLACMEDLEKTEMLYHRKCAVDLFGFAHPPIIDVSLGEIEKLALSQINQRLTLTGVQKKLSLSAIKSDGKKERLTVAGLDGHFILKPPSDEYPEMPEIEHFCMRLAKSHGLSVARSGLVFLSSGELAYVTRRFDRVAGTKVQVEDFCQLSEKPTAKKYSGSTESQ